jgi:hypothetical protein
MWLYPPVDDKLLDTLDFSTTQSTALNPSRCLAQLTQSRSCASVAVRDDCPFFRDVGNGRIHIFTWPTLVLVSSHRGRNAMAVRISFSSCLTSTGCTMATSLRDGAGWYRGSGPSVPGGGRRWSVERSAVSVSPRRRAPSERDEAMDRRWWCECSFGRCSIPLEKSHCVATCQCWKLT